MKVRVPRTSTPKVSAGYQPALKETAPLGGLMPFAPGKARSPRGAVLLEVVLALALFVGAAAVITGALNSSLDGVQRQKLNLHAANLAVSVLSELQMGARSAESAGPEDFPAPFERWNWQLSLTPLESAAGESSGLTRVEVIIRHDDPPLVHRLAQLLKLEKATRVLTDTNSFF